MPEIPALSVVVPTYNRAETLRRVLHCLAEQTLEPHLFELVLVSDHSPDHTRQVVEELAPQLPLHLEFVENQVNRGPGYSQNEGIRRAQADIVLLMADDILQTVPSLRAHLEFHRRLPQDDVAALGKVLQSPDLNQSVFLRNWDPFKFRELEGMTVLPRYRFWACNISFKRRFMLAHGMFREDMGVAGGHEDTEVGCRLADHGLRIHYLPEALAHHHHVFTLDEAARRWHFRGLKFHQLRELIREPEMTVFLHVLDRHTLTEYVRVLRGPNSFRGREKSLAWHLFRELARRVVLNRVTGRLIWRPMLDLAEKWPWLGRRMNAQTYRAYLYHWFLCGVRDGRKDARARSQPPEAGKPSA